MLTRKSQRLKQRFRAMGAERIHILSMMSLSTPRSQKTSVAAPRTPLARHVHARTEKPVSLSSRSSSSLLLDAVLGEDLQTFRPNDFTENTFTSLLKNPAASHCLSLDAFDLQSRRSHASDVDAPARSALSLLPVASTTASSSLPVPHMSSQSVVGSRLPSTNSLSTAIPAMQDNSSEQHDIFGFGSFQDVFITEEDLVRVTRPISQESLLSDKDSNSNTSPIRSAPKKSWMRQTCERIRVCWKNCYIGCQLRCPIHYCLCHHSKIRLCLPQVCVVNM
ncbi:hypothetical protein BC830DRAFT_1148248 [Chytriomyces sp. MP71]|nr:hypothetical protein BC830DRAFT_1148248 [Chytriomyces sp. MP71]